MKRFADAEAWGKERGWGPEASCIAMEEDEEREDLQFGQAGEGADVFELAVEAVDA